MRCVHFCAPTKLCLCTSAGETGHDQAGVATTAATDQPPEEKKEEDTKEEEKEEKGGNKEDDKEEDDYAEDDYAEDDYADENEKEKEKPQEKQQQEEHEQKASNTQGQVSGIEPGGDVTLDSFDLSASRSSAVIDADGDVAGIMAVARFDAAIVE